MASSHDSVRRAVTTALAGLALGGSATANAQGGEVQRRAAKGARTLVAYFSRSGNTRVVAGLICRARGTDLFEIRPTNPYPEDYLETVAQARKESDTGHEPALQAKVSRLADYDTVFLGFPVWGETTPPPIRSFLSAHDLSGKTLIPFITHGGYGLGNSQAVLARHAPKARLLNGFAMEADQERKTMERVTSWLGGVTVY
nr:flavodoxin [uncultured Albidiferax sp.]